MKLRTLLYLLALPVAAPAQTPKVNVQATPAGVLATPATLWSANAAAIGSAVSSTVTPPWSAITSKPTTLTGYGITDAQALDSDLTAIAALSTTDFGRSVLALSDGITARAYFGLVIGTDVLAPSGSGAALTALNASQLTSGTVPAARLPAPTAELAGAARAYGTIVVQGDSTAQGYLPPAGLAQDWPSLLMASTGWSNRGALINLGVSSDTIANIAANLATLDAAFTVPSGAGLFILCAGHNDLNGGATGATVATNALAVVADWASRGFDTMIILPASVGNFSAPKITERDAYRTAILAQEGVSVDYVVNLADLDEGDTVDQTHFGLAGNTEVKTRVIAKLATPWSEQRWVAPQLQGRLAVSRASAYSSAISVQTPAATSSRLSDTNVPVSTGLDLDNRVVWPIGFPTDRGINLGSGGATSAILDSSITLTGDFFVGGWINMTNRVYLSGSNTAPLLVSASGAGFFIAGGTGKIFYKDAGGTDHLFPGTPAIPFGRPVAWGILRVDGRMRVVVEDIRRPSEVISNSDSITVDRFGFRASGAYFQGDLYRLVVKSGNWGYQKIENWNRGAGAELSGGITTELWLEFEDGAGLIAYDNRGSSPRHLTMANDATWYWLKPSRNNVLGTVKAGTWNGSVIGSSYGGAGTVSGLLKANGAGTVSAATAGTDYLAPAGSGAALTGITATQVATTPAGSLAATSQAATNAELDAEKVATDLSNLTATSYSMGAPDSQTGRLYVRNVGAGTEGTASENISDFVERVSGILQISRNIRNDAVANPTTGWVYDQAGPFSSVACGGEGLQFGTGVSQTAGTAVPSWDVSWQMAIDQGDGAVRMRNALAIGEVFNWGSWRDGEVFRLHKDKTTGGIHESWAGQANNIGEVVLTDNVTTGYANFRLTHETAQASGSVGDGLGSSFVFAIRGISGTGLAHTDLGALDVLRTGANTSGSFVFRVKEAGTFKEGMRLTEKGVLAFGLNSPTAVPSTSTPGIKSSGSALEVRRADDSGLGPINFLSQAAGVSGTSGATTAWVQGERASSISLATAATLAISSPTVNLITVTGAAGTTITAFSGATDGRTYTLLNATSGNLTIQHGSPGIVVRGGADLVLAALEACTVTKRPSGGYSVH